MPGKFKIVVSDLHLGAGHAAGANPLEDFSGEREFVALLRYVAAESERTGAEVELILNGDTFEMLQVPHVEQFEPGRSYTPEEYHSSSEEDSARKMAIIVEGHDGFFGALGSFLRSSSPRRTATFVKGNHDLNLHWPAVQDCIRTATGAAGRRASLLAFEERRIVREGIYVEHGNQYAETVNLVHDMDEPHDPGKPGQLELPIGSRFVMDVLNRIERDRYWVDGVKPITALIWYALAFDFGFAVEALAILTRALPGIVWEGVPGGRDIGAEWATVLRDPDELGLLAARYQADQVFRVHLNNHVASILDGTAGQPGLDAIPQATLADPVAMGDRARQQTRSLLSEVAARRAAEEGVKLITFGHTHDPVVESLPNGAVYVNSGTWTWQADFRGTGKEGWRELFAHPERFTGDRLLTYLRVDYDQAGQPSGQLMAYQPSSPPEGLSSLAGRAASLWVWLFGRLREGWRRVSGGG